MSIIINNAILTENHCYKTKKIIIPKGIMVHSTATPGASVNTFIKLWNKSNITTCVHAFIDDTGIYQTLPWNFRAGHCGSGINGSGNNSYISFEICEPSGFKYIGGATMVNYDIEKNKNYFNNVYQKAVELCVYLCEKYNLTTENIICHSEGHSMGIASNHADVMHWFPKHNKNMDIFREDVRILLDNKKEKVSNWAKESWDKAVSKKILDGTNPQNPVTREQLAVILDRLGLI